MSSTEVAEIPAATFHVSDAYHVDDSENFLIVHELMHRGQLLNAYEVRAPSAAPRRPTSHPPAQPLILRTAVVPFRFPDARRTAVAFPLSRRSPLRRYRSVFPRK